MAVTDPQDTLAFHLSRPLSTPRDMRHVPVAKTAAAMRQFMQADTAAQTVPETEALWFYAMNHGMAEVRKGRASHEPLDALLPFVQDYYQVLSPKAVRAFYYLLLICTREARHLHSDEALQQSVTKQFGGVAWDWTTGAIGEQEVQKKLFASPPKMALGPYVATLQHVFEYGGWSSGYGGKAWAAVADCLCRFVHGETSAEMMLDTVWTLAHNNGPIFNKGHMYGMYSPALLKILDVQASGQMHEFILHDKGCCAFAPPALVKQSHWLAKTFGSVGPYVDWYAVEALGSKHKYMVEKLAQAKLHGVPPEAAALELAAAKKLAAQAATAQAAALAEQAQEKAAWFEVMPGLKLAKHQRQQAA